MSTEHLLHGLVKPRHEPNPSSVALTTEALGIPTEMGMRQHGPGTTIPGRDMGGREGGSQE